MSAPTPTLRLAAPDDAPGVLEIYAPLVRDTAISFQEQAPSAEATADRIRATLARFPWVVADDGVGVAGYAYAAPHRERAAYRWSVEVSVYVHPRSRRRGVGRALYASLLATLKAQGYVAAWAGVVLPNPASEALHRAAGFVPVGVYEAVGFKLGMWRDTRWWRCALRPPPPVPAEPVPLPALLASPAWPAPLAAGAGFLR